MAARRARSALVALLALLAASAPTTATGTPTSPAAEPVAGVASLPPGEWLAGDLHVHTTYSHDSWGGPGDDNTGFDEAYTLGLTVEQQFALAAARGLDYLAITDHNDVRSQDDPGFGTDGVIPVPGYENSLSGHAQMLGATRIYDNGDRSTEAVQALADELRADGGVFQINHPAEGSTDFPHDQDWSYGTEIVPDTVEVWNINRAWQPPMPSASSNDDAVRLWESFLDAGHRVGATGGSDNHWAHVSAAAGVGQPTTWVFAAEPTSQAVLEGLRAGRTSISHQPPAHAGPRLFLEADADGDGTVDSMIGDAVPPGTRITVRVEGAPGSFLRIFTDGGEALGEPVPVTSTEFTHEVEPPVDATWIRAEIVEPDLAADRQATCDPLLGDSTTYCRNQVVVLGLTSAMFFAVPDSPCNFANRPKVPAPISVVPDERCATSVARRPTGGENP